MRLGRRHLLAAPLAALGSSAVVGRASGATVSSPLTGQPRIAVVIDDLGPDRKRSERASQLPGPLTLAWLPYAEALESQTAAARAAGHELLVHVPMEPFAADQDPGPGALRVGQGPDEIRRRLDCALDRFEGHVGINNHMGSRFTSHAAAMAPVIVALQERGLLFLDSRTAGGSVAGRLAREAGLAAADRDVFIDHDNDSAAILHQLGLVEAIARRRGHAVAIGHPRDHTLAALGPWLADLPARGFALARLSAIVRLADPPRSMVAGG